MTKTETYQKYFITLTEDVFSISIGHVLLCFSGAMKTQLSRLVDLSSNTQTGELHIEQDGFKE